MEYIIDNFAKNSMSDADILTIAGDPYLGVLKNSEIHNFKDIDSLLGRSHAKVILYDKKDGSPGHWSCVFKYDKDTIEFFCPYGLDIDEATMLTGGRSVLRGLLLNSGYKVLVNKYQLQKYSSDINNCGRYVGLRLVFRMLDLKTFIHVFTGNKGYDSDFFATLLTLFVN